MYDRSFTVIQRTTILLNPELPVVQRDIADCNLMHQRVMSLFRNVRYNRVANRILYRVDNDDEVPLLTIQSTAPLDIMELPFNYTYRPVTSDVDYGERIASLPAQTACGFVLLANANKRDYQSGKRQSLIHPAESLAWLMRQSAQHGFAVGDVQVTQMPRVQGVQSQWTLTYHPTRFCGELTIIDPTRFFAGLTTGIGAAKAHGFGLLEVHTR
jgi:CRISPR system Cascade subunit CasE